MSGTCIDRRNAAPRGGWRRLLESGASRAVQRGGSSAFLLDLDSWPSRAAGRGSTEIPALPEVREGAMVALLSSAGACECGGSNNHATMNDDFLLRGTNPAQVGDAPRERR